MAMITTYPNQIKVKIDKPIQKEMKTFAYFDREALAQACTCLNGSEFKLWIYLMAQAPQIDWWISQRAIEEEFGIPEASYHRAIKGLRDKGYLEDDYAIHQFSKKKCDYSDNYYQIDDIDVITMNNSDTHNDYRNKINNNDNNSYKENFINIDVDKVYRPSARMMNNKLYNVPDYDF